MTTRSIAIRGLSEIESEFDCVLLDQYGVLHTGKAVFPEARECLKRLRAYGKKTLVLSNSGKRAADNVRRIAALGLPPDEYDGIITSGEVAWQGLNDRTTIPFSDLGRRAVVITRGNDPSILKGLDLGAVERVEEADFILLAGIDDDRAEIDSWHDTFVEAVTRKIPMLCANPDTTMFGVTGMIDGPGSLAAGYQAMGGVVHFIGKPHPPIFTAALRELGGPPPERVVMIGDSLDHDILGGRQASIRTLLITSGVHAKNYDAISKLENAASVQPGIADPAPDWIANALRW